MPSLWKSDGTEAGTELVRRGIQPQSFTSLDGKLYFVGTNYDYDGDLDLGDELWKTDGTTAGTQPVIDIKPGREDSITGGVLSGTAGGYLYFLVTDWDYASNPTDVSQLRKSDGTQAGTGFVYEGWGSDFGLSFHKPHNEVSFNDEPYFSAGTDSTGGELWKTDGTGPGTRMVREIRQGGGSEGGSIDSSFPFTPTDDALYFVPRDDGQHGWELWGTDGTANGTVMIEDAYPGPEGHISWVANANGKVFFATEDGCHGFELWMVGPGLGPDKCKTADPKDKKVTGLRVTARKTQKQRGKKIVVKISVSAKEGVEVKATGKVKTRKPNKSYKLKPQSRTLKAGKRKIFKLVPKSKKDAKKIVKAIKKYNKAPRKKKQKLAVKVPLKVVATDAAGNKSAEKRVVGLK